MQGSCAVCAAGSADLVYGTSGDLVCTACLQKEEVVASERRAANAIFAASGGALGLGIVSSVINPMCLFTVLGVLTAVGTYTRHPEYARHMGWKKPAALVIATVGLILSLVGFLLFRILLGLAVDGRAVDS